RGDSVQPRCRDWDHHLRQFQRVFLLGAAMPGHALPRADLGYAIPRLVVSAPGRLSAVSRVHRLGTLDDHSDPGVARPAFPLSPQTPLVARTDRTTRASRVCGLPNAWRESRSIEGGGHRLQRGKRTPFGGPELDREAG